LAGSKFCLQIGVCSGFIGKTFDIFDGHVDPVYFGANETMDGIFCRPCRLKGGYFNLRVIVSKLCAWGVDARAGDGSGDVPSAMIFGVSAICG
jgi:hypothetical protein